MRGFHSWHTTRSTPFFRTMYASNVGHLGTPSYWRSILLYRTQLGIVIAAAALAMLAPKVGIAQIVNGDFSAGLTGWTVDLAGGAVFVSGGAAVFQEDPMIGFTALSQDITIPLGAEALSFDFTYTTVPGGTPGMIPDAFSAFLVDPSSGLSLVPGAGFGEEYFGIDSGGTVVLSTGASLDGSATAGTVTLDLTGVPSGLAAPQFFELVGGDNGLTSTVTLDNVQIVLSCPFHPADLDGDFDIVAGEMAGYGTCFLLACTNWAGGGPLPPSAGYASRAGTLFLRGELEEMDYCCDTSQAAPLLWVEPQDCTVAPTVASLEDVELSGAGLAMRDVWQSVSFVDVRIQIRPPFRSSAYAVEEMVPTDTAASQISHGGMFHADLGSIRWGPFLDHEARDLAYQLTTMDGHEMTGSFDGVVSFDGHDTHIQGGDVIVPRPGDADRDGDVDLADFLQMIECFSGAGGTSGSGCEVFDFDGDRDVDLSDLVVFQVLFGEAEPSL